VFRARGQSGQLRPGRWKWQVLRAVIGFIAPCTFFMSLVFLPQADATVLFFSAPLIITLCSVWLLGERFGIHRWVAVATGFIGVYVAFDPQGGHDWRGYVLAGIGSVTYAAFFLAGRYLSKTESTPSLVMSYNVGVGIIGLALLPWFWISMNLQQWGLLLLVAGFAVSGHFCITAAFAKAEASLLSPIEYTTLFWAVFYDWMLWQHTPNERTLLGGGIVILAGLYFIHRERKVLTSNQTAE